MERWVSYAILRFKNGFGGCGMADTRADMVELEERKMKEREAAAHEQEKQHHKQHEKKKPEHKDEKNDNEKKDEKKAGGDKK